MTLDAVKTAGVEGFALGWKPFHKYRIMEHLDIKTSAELVQYAIKHGVIAS